MTENKEQKKKILLIDDDELLLKIYQRIFENSGFDISTANDGDKGLEMIKTNCPDFVIMDIRMPRMDGIEVLQKLKNQNQFNELPIMILSNHSPTEYSEKLSPFKIIDHWVKAEVQPSEIVDFVKKYFSSAKE